VWSVSFLSTSILKSYTVFVLFSFIFFVNLYFYSLLSDPHRGTNSALSVGVCSIHLHLTMEQNLNMLKTEHKLLMHEAQRLVKTAVNALYACNTVVTASIATVCSNSMVLLQSWYHTFTGTRLLSIILLSASTIISLNRTSF
jgi:hypothetical protein